jgi:transposase
MRHRAELLTHVQHTHGPYNLPASGQKLAYTATRAGVAERLTAPAVPKSLAVDLALIASAAQRLRDLELASVTLAKPPEANTRYVLQTIPGVGQIRSLVLWYEIHDLARVPRLQDVVSYGRVVKCAKASAGKRSGTAGTTIGNASLTGAFSEAAVLCLRHTPVGQKDLARSEKQPGTGKALTVLAHTRARAVYDLWKRGTAFHLDQCLQG